MNMKSAASVTVQESAGMLSPEVCLRNGCGPAQECPSIPLEEVGEEAFGEMFSISLLKYANPETQRIGCRIETLTDSFPASDLQGTSNILHSVIARMKNCEKEFVQSKNVKVTKSFFKCYL